MVRHHHSTPPTTPDKQMGMRHLRLTMAMEKKFKQLESQKVKDHGQAMKNAQKKGNAASVSYNQGHLKSHKDNIKEREKNIKEDQQRLKKYAKLKVKAVKKNAS